MSNRAKEVALKLKSIFRKNTTTWDEAREEVADYLTNLPEFQEPTSVSPYTLRDMLAIIHRDGGQHTSENGLEKSFDDACAVIYSLRSQEPKSEWIRCSDRMPGADDDVYIHRDGMVLPLVATTGRYVAKDYKQFETLWWTPRFVPKPPEPEESELVKELRKRQVELQKRVDKDKQARESTHEHSANRAALNECEEVIEIVKRHDQNLKLS